ncbi:hypothetical protein [Streptomyces sp. Tu102]|uniref:hypothetical protein n=1 Tax=Streptomyces sp. Tu102 TaxID=2838019 RepID=UPI001BDD9368|nr:hypothetical protein [Streptomyces sp. Tu102]MBT1095082.1 hypothetical protein [Streptomyces sp. Tu102]
MKQPARPPLTPRPLLPLRGDESIIGVPDATVVDFWRFAMPDLRMNNTRGLFAEFLVHQAVGSGKPRAGWASHDVETDGGLRIEVKAGAYLQAWEQRTPSQIRFSGLRARTWSPDGGCSEAKSYNADVYVFAVQIAREHSAYNPLDTAQWEFYVLPRPVVTALNSDSVGLGAVRAAAGPPVLFAALKDRIRSADPRPDPTGG